LLAVTVAVAGLFVAADRVLAHMASDRLAERIACVAGLEQPPLVTVSGWPFAGEVLTGRYREVTATATGVRWPGLAPSQVTATATDVSVTGDGLTVGAMRAELTIGYPTLARGVSGGDGVLAVRTSAAVTGGSVPVTVYARPVLTSDRLTVEPTEIEAFGVRVPPARFDGRLPALPEHRLPALPAGLTYRAVTAKPDGLALTVAGTGITSDTCGGKPS
jgi:hypothetical protein